MRKQFELSKEELKELLDACRPVPYIIVGGMAPSSPQENANSAGQSLASKKGFIWDSVEPVPGKGNEFFTAECVD